jgi:putative Holliday junction resolvase
MSKILAIDYGRKKIGLAVSDETNTIAEKLPILKVKNQKEAVEGIEMILQNVGAVSKIVVGLPLGLEMKPTQMSHEVKDFVEKLKKRISQEISVVFTNEVLTSQYAEKGRSKKFKKEKSDSEAARIMLQEYLNHAKTSV